MMRIPRRATVLLAVLITSLPLTACHSWRSKTLETDVQLVEYDRPVRLTLRDGSRIELAARISGDSIHSVQRSAAASSLRGVVGIPLSEVRMVEERQFSTGKPVGATIAGLLASFAAIGILTLASSGDEWM